MYRPPPSGTPQLNPNDLFERRVRRDASRLKTYNQVMEQIHTRIYAASQLQDHPAYLIYSVPPFVLGLPKIDLQDCIVYLVYMLRKSEFEVRYTYPNLLYISWKHHEKNYLLNQNPIVQAMLPEQQKKKKAGVTFASMTPLQQQVAPTARKAASEYVPPTTFVQQMDRPQAEKKNNVLSDLWMFS
jgi:Family of unknown function (DUF5759)